MDSELMIWLGCQQCDNTGKMKFSEFRKSLIDEGRCPSGDISDHFCAKMLKERFLTER